MATPKSQRLQIVREMAERRESEAAARLQQALQQLQAEQEQRDQLDAYYQDYLKTMAAQQTVNVNELMRYRGFSQNLAASVRQFDQRIEHSRQGLEALRTEWRQLRHKRDAIEDLIARARREEAAEADRLEQKANDELVNQRFQRQMQDQNHNER